MSNDSTFFGTRGCYYRVKGKHSPSFYSLKPELKTDCPILYNDVTFSGQDFSAKTICFNCLRNVAVVSKDFGEITISGIALLGKAGGTYGFQKAFREYVDKNRIYKKVDKDPYCMISTNNSGAWKFLLDSYELGRIDPEYNMQDFMIRGTLMD